jgi:uncharacterized protein YkwD
MPSPPMPRRFAALCLYLALATVSVAEPPPPRGTEPAAEDPVIAELVEAHNKERAKEGLAPLKSDPKLRQAALAHARDMAEHGKMAHEGSDGSTPAQRAERQGYRYVNTGENVAHGQETVESVMRSWMNSPGHRKNILGDFSEIGAARVLDEKERPYWSVSFGTPLPQYEPAEAATEVVRRMNQVRDAAGLPPLKVAPKLAEAAEAVARDAAERNSIKKEEGEGAMSPQQEVEKRGYAFRQLGQSVSAGQPTPAALVRGLLSGPDAEKAILGDFADVGVGYAVAEKGTPYWCLLFASPPK